MPDDQGRLFASDIAERLGIKASDWRARVARGHAPAPNGYVNIDGKVRSWWTPEAIDEHIHRSARRGPTSNGTEQS